MAEINVAIKEGDGDRLVDAYKLALELNVYKYVTGPSISSPLRVPKVCIHCTSEFGTNESTHQQQCYKYSCAEVMKNTSRFNSQHGLRRTVGYVYFSRVSKVPVRFWFKFRVKGGGNRS